MAFRGKQITATTSAVEVVTEADSAGNGCSVWMTVGANDIWVHGSSDVDTSGNKGRKVAASKDWSVDLNPGERLFMRSATSTSVCHIALTGVD